jgi:hypothetical protein
MIVENTTNDRIIRVEHPDGRKLRLSIPIGRHVIENTGEEVVDVVCMLCPYDDIRVELNYKESMLFQCCKGKSLQECECIQKGKLKIDKKVFDMKTNVTIPQEFLERLGIIPPELSQAEKTNEKTKPSDTTKSSKTPSKNKTSKESSNTSGTDTKEQSTDTQANNTTEQNSDTTDKIA